DLTRLRAAGRDSVLAYGRPAPPGAELLTEVRHVESLLETAITGGTEAGAYGPDDLLVEQLLLGNDRVGDALRRRVPDALRARDTSGVLLSTLRAYLATGSVPEAARREVVHPNTVAYRLVRVREVTGLDPRVPSEAALLVLGLAATGERR
ncbi:MAG TPA: helix-turn-helix domain-containing protein, partial [Mycobacteriales bacterium]|nr:helix-turn-helix domain-containing protein [Mycobacteriales bacterium]